jgi:hypothetical protein
MFRRRVTTVSRRNQEYIKALFFLEVGVEQPTLVEVDDTITFLEIMGFWVGLVNTLLVCAGLFFFLGGAFYLIFWVTDPYNRSRSCATEGSIDAETDAENTVRLKKDLTQSRAMVIEMEGGAEN